jgi:DNA-binding transcriptional LysR family regulator
MPWDERIGRRLKLRDLYVLKMVAQTGSMGRAASRLAVSQPAVSKAITDLEHVLGVRLLDRSQEGVEPTPHGAALLKWSAVVFDDLRQGIEEMDFLADPGAGTVRVGTAEGMPAALVSAVIDRSLRHYPRLTFTVIQAATNDLQYRDLRERNVDLVFGRLTPPIADNDLNAEVLFDDPFFPVAGVNSKWVKKRRIELAELIDELWCLPNDNLFLPLIAKAFGSKGLEMPRRIISTNSIQLYYAMAATGRVLSLASSARLRLAGKELGVKVLPVDLRILTYPIGLVTLKKRSISPAAQLFIDGARQVTKRFSSEQFNSTGAHPPRRRRAHGPNQRLHDAWDAGTVAKPSNYSE